jgi:hypothetical protein
MSNIFEEASRKKIRFESSKGLLTVEDLWDVPLKSGTVNLNQIALGLYNDLKVENISFVDDSVNGTSLNQLKFDLVKYVIDVRLSEKKVAEINAMKKKEKERIMSLIAEKEDNALSSKTIEELRAMLTEL